MRARLAIEDKLLLRASQPWVEAPSALLLPSGGRSFEVKARCASIYFHMSLDHMQRRASLLLVQEYLPTPCVLALNCVSSTLRFACRSFNAEHACMH